MLFENENIRVRLLQENDKRLLVKWLTNQLVLEFYEGRDNLFNLEKVNRSFYNQEKGIVRCVVEYDEQSIGYIQYYQINDDTSTIQDYPSQENIYGLDQFIGEPSYWNRGIGTKLVKAMVNYLMDVKNADRIIMDPQITNERAIKCYEKCGFRKIRILPKNELHEREYRDCWLMEYSN